MELEENNIAVVCISDSKYLVYLKTMLKSLSHSNNNFVVHACLINIKKKVSVKKSLEKIYSNIKIDFLDQEFNKSHHLKAFCANHRAEFIKQVLEINYDALIYSDVDSIFRDRISLEKIITPEADIKVLFRDNDNKKFKGKIRGIVNSENIRTGTRKMRISLDNALPKNLSASGTRFTLEFSVGDNTKRLLIPKDALTPMGEKQIVYLFEKDLAKRKIVQTGISVGNNIEILNGLEEGQLVIIKGNENLRPNQQIKIKKKN